MPLQTMALFFLATVAAGGIAWVFLYPLISGERQIEKRKESVAKTERVPRNAAARSGPKVRREQIEVSLKELEERQKKAKSPPLSVRITQAGLEISKQQFFIGSGILAGGVLLIGLMVGAGLLVSLALALAAGLGLPRWILAFLKKRREQQFLNVFPDAVDVIVRGIKAGLPLLECLKMIANEAPEPVRGEFRAIVETQTIGLPLAEACAKLYERVPVPEANFFGIVIGIQQRAGGNLSEALGNLSRVLRDRKKMKAKIKAMSMEAKASAAIIAALPIAVMVLVYITSPRYIELLWTEPLGRLMLASCVVWMALGVLVMRRMINFDF
ncbi:MAG TPA: type II secretion system F family protein [Xanthobacteraceae bacterium]|nr:type II secretion system F family protein [Xanthobacteraceae bacterium]